MRTQPVARGDAIDLNLERMTVDQGLALIQEERVQPLLKYLKTGVFENKTNMTFMKAYSVVIQFGDQQQHSLKLYSYYKGVIHDYCQESVCLMDDYRGEELLKSLAELWEKQTILVYWMQRVFQYLDRFFTKNNSEYPDLFCVALRSFQETVYDRTKDRCIETLINTINHEREGQDIDLDSVRLLIEMLGTVGDPQPVIKKDGANNRLVWQSQSKHLYKVDFESVLLARTAEYYKTKVAVWLAEYSCPLFLKEVAKRLESEELRLNRYLDRSSETELRTVCQRELILNTAERLVGMESGCHAMFENQKYRELDLMYKLFRREVSTLPLMTGVMEPYIEQRCSKIIDDPQMIDNPERYIEQVLALKAELDEMVSSCFENDSAFQKARNTGLETRLNKDTRCAKFLALFCDIQLKNRLKGRNEDEMNQLVSQVVSLFAHLKDKDIFLDFYKHALSRRLLNKTSVSNDAEDAFIGKLKVECGQQAIQKLASMFTDMALSDQLQEEYNKLSHGGKPGGVIHEVRVLQTNAWPEKPEETIVAPCEEMAECIKAFQSFYDARHSGRKLRWLYNMGHVELTTFCFPKRHLLVVSAYQCLALMLFNKRNDVTFREICEATKLPREECHRQILSMTVSKHRLLLYTSAEDKKIEDATVLQVNGQFVSDKIKVLVSLIKEKEKAVETAVAEAPAERKHVVDAAIVRIMKSRKRLDHNSLLVEVTRQCTLFKPQPQQIKTQIEHLIEREFLKRDTEKRDVYIYLP